MALVKYGSLVTEIKGKLGGQVFQSGAAGPIIRSNYKGSNTRDLFGTPANANFAQLGVMWNALTSAQRIAWNDNAYLFPVLDKWGNELILSGYACYVHINALFINTNYTVLNTPTLDNHPPTTYTMSAVISQSAQQFDITLEPDPINNDEIVFVDMFNIKPTGIVKNWREKRRARKVIEAAASNPHDAYVEYDEQMHGPIRPETVGFFVPCSWFSVNVLNGVRSLTQTIMVQIES